MNRKMKKLSLAKTTLRRLDTGLHLVRGGDGTSLIDLTKDLVPPTSRDATCPVSAFCKTAD